MNRRDVGINRRLFGLGAVGAATSVLGAGTALAQPARRPMIRPRPLSRGPSPADLRGIAELDAYPVAPTLSSAPVSARDRAEAEQIVQTAQAIVLRALMARDDPSLARSWGDPHVVERRVRDALGGMSTRAVAQARRNVLARVRGGYSPIQGIDIRRPGALQEVERRFPALQWTPPPPPPPPPANTGPRYGQANLSLRALKCNQETSGGGADEITLGGVLIGETGNLAAFDAAYLGDFENPGHSYQDFNDRYLGRYSLRASRPYPKELFVIWQLVEVDTDELESAQDLTRALTAVAAACAATGYGAIIAAIGVAVDAMLSWLIADDPFPTMGSRIRLNSENEFGADGVSGRLRTPEIYDDEGRYVIGFRVSLVP